MSRSDVHQGLTLGLAPGQRDGSRPDFVRDLDGRESDAARRRRDHDRVGRFQPGDVDERPVGGHVLHPDGGRLDPRKRRRMVRDQACRSVRQLAVEGVVIQVEAGDDADRVADRKTLDPFTDGGNRSRRLVSVSSRKLGVRDILAGAEHHLGAVESQRFDADLHLALSGGRNFDILDPEDFGPTDLVKSYDSRHRIVLLYVVRP